MSEEFKPIGERARWRMVYDVFRAARIGETITYTQMAELLGLDGVVDRHALQMAARRAGLELERVDRHVADAVKNVGYRIVEPSEVLGLGRRRNRKAGRQIARGSITTAAVDLNEVDGPTRQALETLARGFALQGEINRRVLAKQKQQDDLISRLMQRVDRLEGKG
jgi:hypothetical protein